jgi:hypothetical protein
MEGWTLVKVASIRGAFEGCDFDRLIELDDGTILRCSSYGYQYSYAPTATVWAKRFATAGGAFSSVRLMVEGETYDMQPVPVKE